MSWTRPLKSIGKETNICMTRLCFWLPLHCTYFGPTSRLMVQSSCGYNFWYLQSNLRWKWRNIEWDMMSWTRSIKSMGKESKIRMTNSCFWLPLHCTYFSPTSRLKVQSSCEYNSWCLQSNLRCKWTNIEWDMMSWTRSIKSIGKESKICMTGSCFWVP